MKKFPKPWRRPSRGVWYVTLHGKQHNLGSDETEAFRKYHELMAKPPEPEEKAAAKAPAEYVIGLIQRFIEDVRANAAAETAEWYRHRLQRFTDYLSDRGLECIRVDELKRLHVSEWINTYPKLSPGSKRNLCRAIQRVFNWALECEYIDHNPLAGRRKPRGGKRERIISDAEWSDILTLARDDDFLDLLCISYETGCRPQESLAVEARHVDLVNQRWVFPASESKTDAPRIVYLSDVALAITKRRMARYPRGPLFRNSTGKQWSTDAVNCGFIRIQIRMGQRRMLDEGIEINADDIVRKLPTLQPMKKVKGELVAKSPQELKEEAMRKLSYAKAVSLAPKFCLYTIRHTWMNRLLTNGCDSLTVAILAGHCDPTVLARTYQHLSQNPKFLLEQARRVAV